MKIHGLQKLTLLDFPGKTACTIFLAGCNFRCPFCHNSGLLNAITAPVLMDSQDLLKFLHKRQELLDGVCITGGEPTLKQDLPELLYAIKTLGFQTKLDTNGTNPALLQELIRENLLDYVAMDIKAAPQNYPLLCGVKPNMEDLTASINCLLKSALTYEFRTTVVGNLHKKEDFETIGQWLGPVPQYFLQSFVPRASVLQPGLLPPTPEQLTIFLETIQKYIPKASIRGQ